MTDATLARACEQTSKAAESQQVPGSAEAIASFTLQSGTARYGSIIIYSVKITSKPVPWHSALLTWAVRHPSQQGISGLQHRHLHWQPPIRALALSKRIACISAQQSKLPLHWQAAHTSESRGTYADRAASKHVESSPEPPDYGQSGCGGGAARQSAAAADLRPLMSSRLLLPAQLWRFSRSWHLEQSSWCLIFMETIWRIAVPPTCPSLLLDSCIVQSSVSRNAFLHLHNPKVTKT